MELTIKPGEKMYEDIKYLIDSGRVSLGLFKIIANQKASERCGLYGKLYDVGFLERSYEGKGLKPVTYSPGKHEVLEDRTIVLHARLSDKL